PSTFRRRTGRVGLAYAIIALFDAALTGFRLWRTLRKLQRPDLVLTQNPPAFPTLVVTWFSLRRKGVRFVIDWHNLGFTLLRLRLGRWHPAVRLARWFERRDARRVEANLCVSRGLAAFLESRFGVTQAHVLYDRPASVFMPIDRLERELFRQALFGRLGIRGGVVGFIVCPTSWTEDEDFDVIIEAVPRLEERIRGWETAGAGRRFTDLVILVTGDGARRAEFERRFAGLPARRIQLRARWLEPEDYPKVVGSADLGLCLHRSSSGLDIPMKVADLFGAGVPVCALDYGIGLGEGGGRSFWLLTDLHTFKVVGDDTNGAFTVAELTAGPELGPPPHIHRNHDESFYVLDGIFDFSLAGRSFTAGAGSFVHLPKG